MSINPKTEEVMIKYSPDEEIMNQLISKISANNMNVDDFLIEAKNVQILFFKRENFSWLELLLSRATEERGIEFMKSIMDTFELDAISLARWHCSDSVALNFFQSYC